MKVLLCEFLFFFLLFGGSWFLCEMTGGIAKVLKMQIWVVISIPNVLT